MVTWHGLGIDKPKDSYTVDVLYNGSSSCEETRTEPPLVENASTLCGGAVPNTKINYVNYDDWGIPENRLM